MYGATGLGCGFCTFGFFLHFCIAWLALRPIRFFLLYDIQIWLIARQNALKISIYSRNRSTYRFFFFFLQSELLLFNHLELVAEVEFGCLLLQFCKFVLILGDLLERWFYAEKQQNFNIFLQKFFLQKNLRLLKKSNGILTIYHGDRWLEH